MKPRSSMKIKLPSKESPTCIQQPKSAHSQRERQKKLTRTKRIKQKNIVYPLSTPNKIVFITNQYGVGFRRQKLQQFQLPSHIPVQRMLSQINQLCYSQWKSHHESLSIPPFQTLQHILAILLCLILLLTIIYFTLITHQYLHTFQILNYIITVMIGLIFGIGVYVALAKRKEDQGIDNAIVGVVQGKLMEWNLGEREGFGTGRFRWTCHRDCLWIAINIL